MNRPLIICATAVSVAPLALVGCGDGSPTTGTEPSSTAAVTRHAMSEAKNLWVTNKLPVAITLDVPSTTGRWMSPPAPLAATPKGLVGTVDGGATIAPHLSYYNPGYTRRKATAAPDAQFTLSVTPAGGEAVTIPFSIYGRWTGKTRNKKHYYATNDIGWAPTAGGFQTSCVSMPAKPITYDGASGSATGTIEVTCGARGETTRVTVAPG